MKYPVRFELIYSNRIQEMRSTHKMCYDNMQLRFIDQTTESNFKISVIEQEKSDIVFF